MKRGAVFVQPLEVQEIQIETHIVQKPCRPCLNNLVVLQGKAMAAHPDTRKPWVWAIFAFNTLFGVIFAILSWATFSVSSLSTSVYYAHNAPLKCPCKYLCFRRKAW